jgi:hypothetical protein
MTAAPTPSSRFETISSWYFAISPSAQPKVLGARNFDPELRPEDIASLGRLWDEGKASGSAARLKSLAVR